ncbi:MAG: hypothetical protein MJ230_06425 [bacterium]|nr:hypothetical protein [bacterium]
MDLSSTAWCEKVYIETAEHIICGFIFVPKTGKQSRVISDILSSGKDFIAVKDCTLEYKNDTRKPIENHVFLQVNVASILLMRPYNE